MDSDDTEIVHSTEPIEPCWPFWGLVETREKNEHSSRYPVHGRIFLHHGQSDLFDRFQSIGMEALRMLHGNGRTVSDMRCAATEIQSEIDEWFDLYIEQETENRVQTLFSEGGWELNYLPSNPDREEYEYNGYYQFPTKDEIRNLLVNWSSEWDDTPSLPRRDDFSDLTALQECLGFEEFDKSQLIHFGLIEPEEYEYFAVLALMIICEAVHSNPITVSKHYRIEPTVSQIKAIGHATINAVEAIAYAKRVQFEQKIRTSIALEQPEILANELSRRTSERAVNAANKRHAANNNARDWVCKEWALHCEDYAGNKSEFSRIYAARVKNEFTNSKGEPLSVTDKTIREVWLKNTPTTGK